MKRIDASEQAFGQANRYYLLMWVLVTLVAATAYVENRSQVRDREASLAVVDNYTPIAQESRKVAIALRSKLYALPGFAGEEEALVALRNQYVAARRQLGRLGRLQFARDVTVVDRVSVNQNLNSLTRLIYCNDPTAATHLAASGGQPSLALVEHEFGTLLTATNVAQLRIEDASRFLWLASLGLDRWITSLSNLQSSVSQSNAATVARELATLVQVASDEGSRRLAADLWRAWLRPGIMSADERERRQHLALTLDDPSRLILAAHQQLAELRAKASGEASEVTLPVLSVPIRLADAIVVLPAVLAFCSLAMLIYTSRGLRYAPRKRSDTELVGNMPVYYTPHGAAPRLLALLACLIMLLMPLAVAAIIPLLLEVPRLALTIASVAYWGFSALATGLILMVFFQTWKVLGLIDRDIALRSELNDIHSTSG